MGAHYERARLLFRQGRYEMAERELREELAESPYDGQTHAFLGRCLAQQKRFADALEEGEEGVHLAPHLSYAHYMLAITYNDCGRPKEAEAAVGEALRLDPRNTDQLAWLAWLQFQRGDRRAALATADQGLAIDPQHVTCLNRRGYILRWMGDWKESEVALRLALALAPEDAFTHTNLGWTLWTRAYAMIRIRGYFQPWAASPRPEMRESLDHFREALRLEPGSDWARTGLTEVLLLRRRAVYRGIVAFIGAVLILILFLTAYADPPPNARVILGLVLSAFGVLTIAFADGPVYLLMRRDPMAMGILSPARRRASEVTALCLISALMFAAAAAGAPSLAASGMVFLSLAMVRPLSAACEASAGRPRRLVTAYAVMIAAAGLALIAAMLGDPNEGGRITWAMFLVIFGGMASLRSGQLAQYVEKQLGKKAD